ncbi:hypothetical protein COSHB9_23920 [Companilactobacillus alimentarius]|uniref:PTS EIIA type-2 domain-containing protein n=1 Tax=Companilactobacillus alimentarius DSM 20249 TaxID=1423720 RepID=A0A2K9HEU1_9LACO|nr:PTS sugar transporter subunit IIA [Companilactobacillus alimentarius]AUI71081.1 hypothetical protein LA20249_02195 [Companilactobacillus alimentarius DSM 20249]MDT6951662.1 PTS sugar transporter subunit IIA [Companilactobacillus alimentarius]GEO44021.1 hypothetical protein LAL01_02530 [Companilactobacillus alimentarius]
MSNSLWNHIKNIFSTDDSVDEGRIETNDIHDPQNKARSQAQAQCDFSEILDVKNIVMEVDLHSQAEVLKYLTDFYHRLNLATDSEKLYGRFLLREKESATNLGSGIVMPHAVDSSVQKLTMIILKLENPLMWDDQKVSWVIALLIPESEKDFSHVKYMAGIARLLLKPTFVYALKETTTAKQVEKLFVNS